MTYLLRRGLLVAAVVTAGTGALIDAAPAHAQGGTELVACTGTEIVGFNPGLTLVPQTVDMSAEALLNCVSTDESLSSAEYDTTIEDIDGLSCLSLLVAEEDATTIHWNTGEASHFEFQVQTESLAGLVVTTYTGSIDEGLFEGAAATIVAVADQPNLVTCLSPEGFTEAFGIVELLIEDAL